MLTLPEWVAAGATIAGALMTASNLGTRVTGWGFALFSVGSAAWVATGILNDQTSLIVADGVLLFINLFGVWRWLGRQSRYEDSSARAAARSRHAHVPTLFPLGSLLEATVKGPGDESRGVVVEAMLKCEDTALAYVVVGEGGIGGAGETLRAVSPAHLKLRDDTVSCDLSDAEWRALPQIDGDRWPEAAPGPAAPAHE